MSILVKAKSSTFSQLFSRKYYEIPKFQRAFTWKKEHVNDFWEDLCDAMEASKSHFLGSIVLQIDKRSSKNVVYDGQQRLTVAIALISVITYELEEVNKVEKDFELEAYIKSIRHKYLYSKDTEPYLILTSQDKQYFTKCLLDPDEYLTNKAVRKSNEFLRMYAFKNLAIELKNKVQVCGDNSQKIQYLKNLLSFVAHKIYFAVIFADKQFPAATLFETLNYRGAILQPSDLIKSLIYSKAMKQRCFKKLDIAWNNNLDKLGKIPLNDFLKHFWILESGVPTKGSLYKVMKRYLESGKDIKVDRLVDRMGRYIDIYSDMLKPRGKSRWKSDPSVVEALSAITKFRARECYPFLLSLFSLSGKDGAGQEFNKARKKILISIENAFFRLMVCKKTTPYELEKAFAESSKKVKINALAGIEELANAIKRFFPDEKTFEQDFSTLESKGRMAFYILYKLENNLTGRKEPITNETSRVTIEHIMPQKLGHGWGGVGRYHKDYVNRLGNLTLLSKSFNKGNQGFTRKKNKFYKESNVVLNTFLMKYTKWNKKTITQHQKDLAAMAVGVWTV